MDPISLSDLNNVIVSDNLDINKIFSPNTQETQKPKKSKDKKTLKKKGDSVEYSTLEYDPSSKETTNDTANLVVASSSNEAEI